MAWTAPMTAIDNGTFTAAQFNAQIRDNLLETFPGKATGSKGTFITTASHQVAQRATQVLSVAANETTSSTSYTDLFTVGPTVTATTGGKALVIITANMSTSVANAAPQASFEVKAGASTFAAAADVWSIKLDGSTAGGGSQFGACTLVEGLTAGTAYTFRMKYKTSSGTATFYRRYLTVVPF